MCSMSYRIQEMNISAAEAPKSSRVAQCTVITLTNVEMVNFAEFVLLSVTMQRTVLQQFNGLFSFVGTTKNQVLIENFHCTASSKARTLVHSYFL